MKKLYLILALIICVSTINAQVVFDTVFEPQQPEYVLPVNDIQISFGDGIIFNGFDIYDALGSYTLSYHYNLKKWIALGGFVSYSPSKETRYYDEYSNYGIYYNYKSILNNVSLAFSVRFTYLNRPNAKLYSGCSLGLMHIFEKGQRMQMSMSGQMTFLGFQFGRKFYIGGEIGIGAKGFFTTNLGYKF
ncbi:MAG: hypothetical protein LBS50_00315 [Prevotellaceae bacterium]|jgi:hypothetical protein|nr:hypothetical protein [Prevotellaceae bacterium]